MKIAVIADPHANFIALQTVSAHIKAWGADQVVVLGDIVNRGPRPAECLNFVLDKAHSAGWLLVRGNHEDYVIKQARPDAPRDGPHAEVHRASRWTLHQLDGDIAPLLAMPFQQEFPAPDGRWLRFVHASMLGNRDGIYPETRDETLPAKLGLNTATPDRSLAVFCAGHTHRPLARIFRNTLVVNAGSAGLPFDGDTRPSYAQLTWQHNQWCARIVRLDYDLARAEQDFYDNGYLEGGGPLVKLVQHELRTASSQLYYWAVRYQERAAAGDISMEESVRRHLAERRKS